MLLTNKEIINILNLAKVKYLSHMNSGFSPGMCFCIEKAIELKYNTKVPYEDLKLYIPKFDPKFLKTPYKSYFWWEIFDTHSRIDAFDKLLEYYGAKQ